MIIRIDTPPPHTPTDPGAGSAARGIRRTPTISPDRHRARLAGARQEDVKTEFAWAFDQYRELAWGKDEIRPVSGGYASFRCVTITSASSLIESLDTLWLMGLDGLRRRRRLGQDHVRSRCRWRSFRVRMFDPVGELLSAHLASGDCCAAHACCALAERLLRHSTRRPACPSASSISGPDRPARMSQARLILVPIVRNGAAQPADRRHALRGGETQ